MKVLSNNSYSLSKDAYEFSFKTSSGDSIDFSAYKEGRMSTSLESKNGKTVQTTELSLSSGYKFHYEGDGLDANDIKEIKQALKQLQPDMKEFMQGSGLRDAIGSEIDSVAGSIKSKLPIPVSSDGLAYMKQSLVHSLDDLFKMYDKNQKSFDNSTRLIDKLLAKIDGTDQSIYA